MYIIIYINNIHYAIYIYILCIRFTFMYYYICIVLHDFPRDIRYVIWFFFQNELALHVLSFQTIIIINTEVFYNSNKRKTIIIIFLCIVYLHIDIWVRIRKLLQLVFIIIISPLNAFRRLKINCKRDNNNLFVSV